MFPEMVQPALDAIYGEGYSAGYADGLRARKKTVRTAAKKSRPQQDGTGPQFPLKEENRLAKASKPVCPIHRCEMHPRKVAAVGLTRLIRFYCPVQGCQCARKWAAPARVTCDRCGEVYVVTIEHDEHGNKVDVSGHECKLTTRSLFPAEQDGGEPPRMEGSAA